MKKIRYSQTPIARLQLIAASAMLLTAPKWHWMQCQGPMYDAPIWALTAFVWWRVYQGLSSVRISRQERQRERLTHVSVRGIHV